jgi:hypothetical protein
MKLLVSATATFFQLYIHSQTSFQIQGDLDLPALFEKKNQKLNKKNGFFQLKVRSRV